MPDASVTDHRNRIRRAIAPLPPVEVPLAQARGRALAADVAARLAVPPFDHSAMDGFAVRAADVTAVPVELPVAGVVAAGDPVPALEAGTAIRIMTGAEVPPGADLVVPFEWTTGTDPVRVLQTAAPGRHIRRRGEDLAAGEVALAEDAVLGPAQLGLLTSTGLTSVLVRARPRVGIVSTGAELVNGHVPDSNSATLAAASDSLDADATCFGPSPDDPAAFLALLREAASVSDLVVTTGGVSAGDHDVVKAALRDEPGFWFGAVAMKPGRPQGFGLLEVDGRQVPVLCLPGTPIAAYASFLLYGREALARLAGGDGAEMRLARLGAPVDAGDRTVLLPGEYDENGCVVPLPGHAGHSQRLLARAEVLMVVPPLGRTLDEGAIEVLFL
ncbi:MAG TPA: gephyrin-like molybdotransferase Glp [Nocardioides sp.]|nr:gephyrin-like molybdotransferase Glp [Nocardioides sp.]